VIGKIPSFETKPPDATSSITQYDLTLQKEAYQHTHSAYVSFTTPCAVASGGVLSGYALTITVPNQPSSTKDDSNAVKINGTVTLPKATSSTPAAPKN